MEKLNLGGVFSQRRSRLERATRSLAKFVRSHCSHRSLTPQCSTVLRSLCSLAPFTGSLTHFAHSLVGQLKFLNMCSHCYRVSREQTRFWRSLETRPKCHLYFLNHLIFFLLLWTPPIIGTRPDTRLPQSRAGGQGIYLRSLHHLGRSCETKDRKNTKK